MPELIANLTVSYTDPESGSVYEMTARKVMNCETAQRTRFTLSSASNTQIVSNGTAGLTTANPQYINIENVGDQSAYILINDGANPFEHEIAAGAKLDLFGEIIYGSGAETTFQGIYAKGDTELEVDVFM